MAMKRWICLCFALLLWIASPAFSSEKIKLKCEVLEVSDALKSASTKLNGIRYILLHHANAEDRGKLSKWLKAHSGTEVTFIINHREYEGILNRLAHCFGRGLLIYTDDIRPNKRDIIEVILSPFP